MKRVHTGIGPGTGKLPVDHRKAQPQQLVSMDISRRRNLLGIVFKFNFFLIFVIQYS